MRKIVVGAQVSLDGVMQAPGGPTEDPTKGFKFGGWAIPYFDQAGGEEIDHLFQNFDLLLGRKTYEIFAAYWPYYDESAPAGSIARRFNEIKKYAVSRSGNVDTSWKGSVPRSRVAHSARAGGGERHRKTATATAARSPAARVICQRQARRAAVLRACAAGSTANSKAGTDR